MLCGGLARGPRVSGRIPLPRICGQNVIFDHAHAIPRSFHQASPSCNKALLFEEMIRLVFLSDCS